MALSEGNDMEMPVPSPTSNLVASTDRVATLSAPRLPSAEEAGRSPAKELHMAVTSCAMRPTTWRPSSDVLETDTDELLVMLALGAAAIRSSTLATRASCAEMSWD